ncbi:oligosaccharide flippase family protein [Sphaerobacter sp.]|uniref:oligosaccharide flippase family protein n=1 Tax=Sphaerobacter sp. TaxID=2099654 RepID=UPI001D6FEEE5|nr:oligosaccharide flippase family protein [Sphaerobacter sp.]MBX5445310.1 oligosaccharide flippase family protein [Sphaerobacter sp.]
MSLREQVLKGGVYLALREGFGLIVSLGGVLLLTRLIGPAHYGLYTGSVAIVVFVGQIGRMGIDVCLIRSQESPDASTYHQAFTLLLLSGVGLALGGILLVPLLAGWAINPHFVDPLRVLLGTLPLSQMIAPATARLERDLNYRAVAIMDLMGQIVYYLVALPLAVLGAGVWAAVAGYWCLQIIVCIYAYTVSRYRPRLVWSRSRAQALLGYGLGYSGSQWLWQLRSLVNPLIVGRFLGPAGVGYVSLAVRFAEVLSFFRNVSWRLSIAALAKVQTDHARLRAALEEAMALQVLAVGPLLGAFSLLAHPVIPLLFGARWSPALRVYPAVAVGALFGALFNIQSSTLYVLRRNAAVAWFHVAHVVVLAASAWFFVPRFGLMGYGLAEIVAVTTYALLHIQMSRVFRFSYAQVLPWLAALIPPLGAVLVPLGWRPVLWVPLALVALLPRQRRQIGHYLGYVVRWRTA